MTRTNIHGLGGIWTVELCPRARGHLTWPSEGSCYLQLDRSRQKWSITWSQGADEYPTWN